MWISLLSVIAIIQLQPRSPYQSSILFFFLSGHKKGEAITPRLFGPLTTLGNETRDKPGHALDRTHFTGIDVTGTVNRHPFAHGSHATHA